MKLKILGLLLLSASVAGAAEPPRHISGQLSEAGAPEGASGPRIGVVADSQLQTRANYVVVRGYRGEVEDWAVPVSIRPPALDWAARSLLRSHLAQLRAEGAEAIFYLGDGANNGCHDEFAAGFSESGSVPAPNDQGLLALLHEFREGAKIPVFFVLGNHDLLGAGSTGDARRRTAFCDDGKGGNAPLTKAEVIRLVETLNRANARFSPAWSYTSNFDERAIERSCGPDPARQHRSWGCYLAGRVDYRGPVAAQFLLLDTNDWVNVSESRYFRLDQEGLRGAMSFGAEPRSGVVSQTRWFEDNAAGRLPLRVALSHYDIPGLRKKVPLFGAVSKKSQQFMSLFTSGGAVRTPNQDSAFMISAHTHRPRPLGRPRRFATACGMFRCDRDQRFSIAELNVGSTTDYSNYSTLVQFDARAGAPAALYYKRVDIEPRGCGDVYADLSAFRFARKFRGRHDQGWAAIGIDPAKRHNYRRFTFPELADLWANLEQFTGTDARRANCIGLYAAALEEGVDPLRRPPRNR